MDPVTACNVRVDSVETVRGPEGHKIPSYPCPRSGMKFRVNVPADRICWVRMSRSRPHHKRKLDVAETRLMVDLEPTDKPFCVTLSCGEQQLLGSRARAEQDGRTKPADAGLVFCPRLS